MLFLSSDISLCTNALLFMQIWWGSVNKKMSPETFTKLKGLVVNHFNKASKIYVFDGYAGSSPVSRQRVSATIVPHIHLTRC